MWRIVSTRSNVDADPQVRLTSIDLDDAPALSLFERGLDASVARRGGRLGFRDAGQRIQLHLAPDFLVHRRCGTAMEPYPETEQRIGEAVALLSRRHEVDVFEPREIVLRRSGCAAEPLRDLGERQPFLLRQDVEDGLERAVAARAMQPQLVAEMTPVIELAIGRHQRRQGADRVGGAAKLAHRVAAGSDAGGPFM